MKVVYVSLFQDEALVVQSLLASAGIECALLAGGMLDMNPLFATDIHGVRVTVADEVEADALAVVADYRARKREP